MTNSTKTPRSIAKAILNDLTDGYGASRLAGYIGSPSSDRDVARADDILKISRDDNASDSDIADALSDLIDGDSDDDVSDRADASVDDVAIAKTFMYDNTSYKRFFNQALSNDSAYPIN